MTTAAEVRMALFGLGDVLNELNALAERIPAMTGAETVNEANFQRVGNELRRMEWGRMIENIQRASKV